MQKRREREPHAPRARAGVTKLFVLDTNVLMHDPTSLFRFEEHDLYLPIGTLLPPVETTTVNLGGNLPASGSSGPFSNIGPELAISIRTWSDDMVPITPVRAKMRCVVLHVIGEMGTSSGDSTAT